MVDKSNGQAAIVWSDKMIETVLLWRVGIRTLQPAAFVKSGMINRVVVKGKGNQRLSAWYQEKQ